MSKIANITMAAAIAASAFISGTASASDYYGPDADPYPKMMRSGGQQQQATRPTDLMHTGSVKKGPVSSKSKAMQHHRGTNTSATRR